jgi:hypothetical protein
MADTHTHAGVAWWRDWRSCSQLLSTQTMMIKMLNARHGSVCWRQAIVTWVSRSNRRSPLSERYTDPVAAASASQSISSLMH